MLSWLFASLDTERDSGEGEEPKVKAMASGPKPVFVILQQIAPMLRTIVSNWIMDAGVVEVSIWACHEKPDFYTCINKGVDKLISIFVFTSRKTLA